MVLTLKMINDAPIEKLYQPIVCRFHPVGVVTIVLVVPRKVKLDFSLRHI